MAGAFASGSPLLGGIAVAGEAFKGLTALFNGGKSATERFIESVRKAGEALRYEFAVFDIDDPTEQFNRVLETAIGEMPGWIDKFFEGANVGNIEDRIREFEAFIAQVPESLQDFLFGEQRDAARDFFEQLERLGDQAEGTAGAIGSMAASLTNVPKIFDYALRRRQAALAGAGPVDTGGGGGGGTGGRPGGPIAESRALIFNISADSAATGGQAKRNLLKALRDPEVQYALQTATA